MMLLSSPITAAFLLLCLGGLTYSEFNSSPDLTPDSSDQPVEDGPLWASTEIGSLL